MFFKEICPVFGKCYIETEGHFPKNETIRQVLGRQQEGQCEKVRISAKNAKMAESIE